ncbi:MAG: branched-chain amino acid ABC transporter permease [Oscillatoriales cyanobacterium C42_A2020_001]|nr:branched-chain amino acid ABC transporter permease [Leptolyngbyaceae cyanobacterium C42_A2020_001]
MPDAVSLQNLLSPGYVVSLIIFTATYALFSLGLNLQWGFTGLLNFGHVAFMTVGAYTTVLLSLQGIPLWLATLIGAVLAALLGLALGATTLRLREDYLAILTIGASEVIRLIALNEEWLTRGALGVPITDQYLPLGALTRPTLPTRIGMVIWWTVLFALAAWQLWRWLRHSSDRPGKELSETRSIPIHKLVWGGVTALAGGVLYGIGAIAIIDYARYGYKVGLMLLLVTVLAFVYWRLEVAVNAPWGRVLKSIREDEEVARALGKNVFWYKLQSLMLGGAIAGVAGAFYAWNLTFINPDGFIPLITFQAWIIVVLGGSGNNAGTLLGAVIYWMYFTVTRFALPAIVPLDDARLGALRIMVIGLLLIILMMVRPQGILGKKEELTLGR